MSFAVAEPAGGKLRLGQVTAFIVCFVAFAIWYRIVLEVNGELDGCRGVKWKFKA